MTTILLLLLLQLLCVCVGAGSSNYTYTTVFVNNTFITSQLIKSTLVSCFSPGFQFSVCHVFQLSFHLGFLICLFVEFLFTCLTGTLTLKKKKTHT